MADEDVSSREVRGRMLRSSFAAAACVAIGLSVTLWSASQSPSSAPAAASHAATANRLTAVQGITVGQHTLSERPTGCTVVLVDGAGATGGVSQRGGAPGTRETDLLDPSNLVDKVNAVVLAGGSGYRT